MPKPQTFHAFSVRQAEEMIRTFLENRADARRARGGQAFFREPVALYGVSSADARQFVKELYGRVRGIWGWEDSAALCDRMLPDPHLEVKGIAILLLGKFIRQAPPALLERAKSWIQAGYAGNWATVDTLCPEVIAPLLLRYPGLRRKIREWPSDRNMWVQRASVVSLIPLVRGGIALDEGYSNAKRLLRSPEDLIQKASGWFLREAGKADAKRLERFLLQHGPSIPRTTLRYAIERFPPANRRRLLAATR